MIRKAIIAILSLVAVSLFVVYLARVDDVYWMEWGSRYTDREAWGLSLIRGGLGIWYNDPNPQKRNRDREYDFRGFNLTVHENYRGYRYYCGRIPLWAPALLASLYPGITFTRGPLRRWRCRREGLCLNCGYNLTGLPEPRCPECGEPTEGGEAKRS